MRTSGHPHPQAPALALALVLATLASSLPPGAAAADPCGGVLGAGARGDHVCLDGQTIALAPGPASEVRTGAHAGVAFVTFDAVGHGFAVVREGAGPWSPLLPADRELRLRAPSLAAPEGPVRVVQLATPLLPAWADALARLGVTLHAYLPENAFVARMPDPAPDLADLPFVTRVVGLAPEAKVEPGLLERTGPVLVNVLLLPGAPSARAEALAALRGLGAEVVRDSPELERITARVDAARLRELAALPSVLWVDQESLEASADMDHIRAMTGADAVSVALPQGFEGRGVVGEVMDVGFQPTHPDFQPSLLAVDGPFVVASHGTSVYGIVFGSGQGDGFAKGMAPEARGVMAYYRSGQTRYQHAQHLVANWSGVFQTHSWGAAVPLDNTYTSHSVENDRIVAELGVLVLQSMSNFGPLNARREAMAKNILAVGALYHEDTDVLQDDLWHSPAGGLPASTGPASDGRRKPELAGPYDAIYTTATNGYTDDFGGTSGATPVVAGAVALAHEMYRANVFGNNPSGATASPAAIKALLLASAEPYLPYQLQSALPVAVDTRDLMGRAKQGWGLPDLAALLEAGPSALVVDQTAPLATSGAATFPYTLPADAQALRVSLVWTDPPANPAAAKALVNDLDLEVVSPEGDVVYRGNVGLDSAPYSEEGGAADRLNNVENVFVLLPEAGVWTVRVIGAAVSLDADPGTPAVDQAFALAVLGLKDLTDAPMPGGLVAAPP